MKLSDKQKRFVDEYLIDLNATQAAIRAGYSKKTARSQGQRLLTKVDIQNALKARMEEKEEELIMKQDEILKRLTKQARREEIDYQVVVLKTKRIEDGVIEENERAEIVQVPTKNNDTIRALDLLGRRYAMWTDKQHIETVEVPTFIDDIAGEEDD